MDRIFFADIDTQRDFMLPAGALYVPGAEKLIPKLRLLFDFARKNRVHILSSADAHPPDDPEFEQFPPHCIEGTEGQRKLEETLLPHPLVLKNRPSGRNLAEDVKKHLQIIVEKQAFDVFSNPVTGRLLRVLPPRAVVFGVATEFCVQSACLGLQRNGVHTVLLSDAVKALASKTEKVALDNLLRAGVEFTTLNAILGAASS
ncbi:MAG: isochorismatase family protein [Acidobacteria bacterium]|nr:isochorismatase family protein [Acidobacteriota bacterium]